jgi:hypothetical protein
MLHLSTNIKFSTFLMENLDRYLNNSKESTWLKKNISALSSVSYLLGVNQVQQERMMKIEVTLKAFCLCLNIDI